MTNHDFDKTIIELAERIRAMRCRRILCYQCPFFKADGWNERCEYMASSDKLNKWLDKTDTAEDKDEIR